MELLTLIASMIADIMFILVRKKRNNAIVYLRKIKYLFTNRICMSLLNALPNDYIELLDVYGNTRSDLSNMG